MSYSIVAQGGRLAYGVKFFRCDTIADLDDLPAKTPGCRATIIDTGEVYVLNNQRQWTLTSICGGSGEESSINSIVIGDKTYPVVNNKIDLTNALSDLISNNSQKICIYGGSATDVMKQGG